MSSPGRLAYSYENNMIEISKFMASYINKIEMQEKIICVALCTALNISHVFTCVYLHTNIRGLMPMPQLELTTMHGQSCGLFGESFKLPPTPPLLLCLHVLS